MFCIMLSFMVSLSIIMMFMKHPLSMGLTLILQTIMVAIITGMMIKTFLFSYILMIIMISGALVLFIYMASIASNEKFESSIKSSIMFLMINVIVITGSVNYMSMNKQDQILMTLSKMFNNEALMTMLMIMFLMFSMIVVSSIASIKEGPLRMKT
uniref:NADH dehydrogenase subunit 6 n=1 Tax=Megacopta cribriella TaxID=2968964 RepID=UPI002238E372|nr:NADH dehydrogenase subunit 6 [Megacopta cribriella]UYA97730.1 NADH dehydrogenase subunit 6 [Megacopta cribriella]UYA97743.1 NADH dehydrogenase subunit 6 [Megacopta cribriella]